MNSEEWVRTAIKLIDEKIFNTECESNTHPYQISWGRKRGSSPVECIQPSEDGADDAFFPTTFVIDFQEKDEMRILAGLTLACIPGFLNIFKGKLYTSTCQKYGFEKPYKKCIPGDILNDILNDIRIELGKFPNEHIEFKKKQETKPTKKTKMFCPNCGYEVSVKASVIKKFGLKPLTCICGTQMGIDYEEEEDKDTDKQG